MSERGLRQRVLDGDLLAGTFLKTPAIELVEVLAMSGLDFLCLDGEHAPFDRARTDACLAIGRALGLPMLVRVPAARDEYILSALDSGATGIVVPHVDDVQTAAVVSSAARFGRGGRGYAGSTRWAGFATQKMPDILARSAEETLVIAQIEDPDAVKEADAIAAVPGIDALFLGPSDLSVAFGKTDLDSPELAAAYKTVGAACKRHGKGYASWVAGAAGAAALRPHGVSMYFAGSEHNWMLQGARQAATDIQTLPRD